MKNNNLHDPAFRQKITNLNEGSLAELVGILGDDVKVKVVKNTKETYYVTLPADPSNVDLANIQAAGAHVFTFSCTGLYTITATIGSMSSSGDF